MGLPRDIYLSKHWLQVDFGITGWAQRLDPVTVLNLAYRSDGPWNESHFSHRRVDELITEIRSSLEPAERERRYAELQEIFYQHGPIVVISKPILHGLSRRVDGFSMSIAGMGDWRWVGLQSE
jgi:peptide/nickel transport system substrate-binding protein